MNKLLVAVAFWLAIPTLGARARTAPAPDDSQPVTLEQANEMWRQTHGGGTYDEDQEAVNNEFHEAAAHGNVDLLARLLEWPLRPEVNSGDVFGRTALVLAATNDQLEAVKFLLALSGRDQISVNQPDSDGDTALLMAVAKGDEEMVKRLLGVQGIDVNTRDRVYKFPDGDVTGGMTPLLMASNWGRPAIVTLLVEANADASLTDGAGRSPLQRAIHDYSFDIIGELLKARGSDINYRCAGTGDTALHMAAKIGSWQTVTLLLKTGADATFKNSAGKTPYQEARDKNDRDVISAFNEAGITE